MRTRINLVIDAVLTTVYALAANPRITGFNTHESVGLGFALIAVVHLIRHRDWVASTLRRLFSRLAARSRIDLAVDTVALASAAVVTVSGFAISTTLGPLVGLSAQSDGGWRAAHLASADVLLASVLAHGVLHWKWIARAFKLHVLDRIDGALKGAASPGLGVSAVAWGVPAVLLAGLIGLGVLGAGNVALAETTQQVRFVDQSSAYISSGAGTTSASSSSSSGGTLVCPRTGCTASTCHGATGSPPPSR